MTKTRTKRGHVRVGTEVLDLSATCPERSAPTGREGWDDKTPFSVARVTRETRVGRGCSSHGAEWIGADQGRACIDTPRTGRVSSRASQGRVDEFGARSQKAGSTRPSNPRARGPEHASLRAPRTACPKNERVRIRSHEADIPAESDQAPSNPRIPGTDEDQGRAGRFERPTRQGSQAPRRQHLVEVGVKRDLGRTGESAIGVDAADAVDAVADAGSRRFRPSDRLLDSRDFTRVLRRGRRRSSAELVVVTSEPRPDGQIRDGVAAVARSRLGITVGRKAGPSVKRNRFKRRVREWFRHHRGELRNPLDIVVIARRPGIDLSLADLGERLSRLLGLDRPQGAGKTQDS